MARPIVAITGLHGAGRQTAANYLAERHGYSPLVSVSGILSQSAATLNKPDSRHGRFLAFAEMGSDYFFEQIERGLAGINGFGAVVSPVQDMDLYNVLRSSFDMRLLHIYASPEKRFARLPDAERSEGDAFLWHDVEEARFYRTNELVELAHFGIDNNGTIGSLYAQLDEVAARL